jgi:SAM-dependent methyltransferase
MSSNTAGSLFERGAAAHGIRDGQVKFLSANSPPLGARLFERDGELFRMIMPRHVPFFASLFDGGAIETLIDRGLVVETWRDDAASGQGELVIGHRRMRWVTYPHEWPAAALKDAALLQLDVNLALAERGAACVDAHPWNVLFAGSKPVFIDVGSFRPLNEIDPFMAIEEFKAYYLYPLEVMALGQRRIARSLLRDFVSGITRAEYDFLVARHEVPVAWRRRIANGVRGRVVSSAERIAPNVLGVARTWKQRLSASAPVVPPAKAWTDAMHRLRDQIEAITLDVAESTWVRYDETFVPFEAPDRWTKKQEQVAAILRELDPPSVLDIGSNRGWYAQYAARIGAAVVACDIDEGSLDLLYADMRRTGASVNPTFLNLRAPSPAEGWSGKTFPPASTRLQASCVLALAIVHHLVFWQLADFDVIANALCQFTTRDILVEFVDKTDRFVRDWWTPEYEWYTLDGFVAAMRARFETVDVLPPNEDGRHLLVCRRVTTR